MSEFIQLSVLAIIQGLTEFLPVSSSAHLALLPFFMDWQDQGLQFDVAVHLGTLLAVCIYFFKDIKVLIVAWFSSIKYRKLNDDGRLAWSVIIATLPIVIFGLLFRSQLEEGIRSPLVIAIASIIFGVLLWIADRRSKGEKSIKDIGFKTALWVGLAQVIAIIPGVSRSGITMTAALLLNYDRQTAAKFSFLLAIPTILMAFLWQQYEVLKSQIEINYMHVSLGVFISFLTAILSIHWFLKLLNRLGMLPFVIYRIALGIVIIFMVT